MEGIPAKTIHQPHSQRSRSRTSVFKTSPTPHFLHLLYTSPSPFSSVLLRNPLLLRLNHLPSFFSSYSCLLLWSLFALLFVTAFTVSNRSERRNSCWQEGSVQLQPVEENVNEGWKDVGSREAICYIFLLARLGPPLRLDSLFNELATPQLV